MTLLRNCLRGLSGCALIAAADPAMAIGEVSGPNITKDKFLVEYGIVRTFDDERAKDQNLSHELELKYGATKRLRYELKLEVEDERDRSAEVDAIEVGAQYQLFEKGANWLDSAIKLSYAHKPYDAEEIKAKLLLEKRHGDFMHRANVSLGQEVGHDAESGGPGWNFQWSSRYKLQDAFAVGFEVDSDPGRVRDFGESDAQEHYAGPAVYGKLLDSWGYEAAYFFGLNETATDGAAMFIVEYGVQF